MVGRRCTVCAEEGRRREMPADRRHLHELNEGDSFVDHAGRVRTVVSFSSGRALVSGAQKEAEHVSFETNGGEDVEFEIPPRSQAEAWSPTAIVRQAA